MKSFFAALAGVASAQTMDPLLYTFMQHINKFDLKYETMEMFEMRFSQFKKAHQEIEEHNASGANFTMGHNQFSTWTQKEFDSIMGFLNIDRVATEYAEYEPTNADSVDWVPAGPSPPLVLWRVPTSSPLATLFPSLRRTWSL